MDRMRKFVPIDSMFQLNLLDRTCACFPDVTAVLLSDVIFFLQENNQKYIFAAFDNKVSEEFELGYSTCEKTVWAPSLYSLLFCVSMFGCISSSYEHLCRTSRLYPHTPHGSSRRILMRNLRCQKSRISKQIKWLELVPHPSDSLPSILSR